MKVSKLTRTLQVILIMVLVSVSIASKKPFKTNQETIPSKLTSEQMSLLSGGQCSLGEWLVTVGAWAGCLSASGGFLPVAAACLAAAGGTINCINTSTLTPVTQPPCTDPCYPYSGAYEEDYATCQQIGSWIVGSVACGPSSSNPQRICCQDPY